MKKVHVSLILPIYNEGPTLAPNLKKIYDELKQIKKPFEIIFVEDKSIDESKGIIENFAKGKTNVRVLLHKTNLGRGRSVKDGILAARGATCGYMDVDCEVSPKYLGAFVDSITRGDEMAVGKRFYKKNVRSIFRAALSKTYASVVHIFLNIPVEDTEVGFKFFKRNKILSIIKKTKDDHWFWDTEVCALAHYAGLKIHQIPVVFKKSKEKKSTVKIIPDSTIYLLDLIKFSLKQKRS